MVLVVGHYAVDTADILSPIFQSLAHTLANKITLSRFQLSCANRDGRYYHEAAAGLSPSYYWGSQAAFWRWRKKRVEILYTTIHFG